MDHRTLDGPSCTTVMTLRDPSPKGLHTFSKCPKMDIDDGMTVRPAYPS